VSNSADTANSLIYVPTNYFFSPNIYAVSVTTNASAVQVTGWQTNTIFYVVPQATNNTCLRVYTNYTTAAAGTGFAAVPNASVTGQNTLLYLTNLTSFNADVIQTATGTSTRTGVYDV
jgi:hypothetical protein